MLAVSEPLARRAEELIGLPAGSVGVARIPLPVALAATPIPDGSAAGCWPPGGRRPEKGFDVLVAALARPEAAGVAATLVVGGPERAALEAQVAEPRARRPGGAPRPRAPAGAVRRSWPSHQVVVVPVRTEGLGMVALEALALGRPVVASAVGGLPVVVADGVDGALVAPDDPDALAGALVRRRRSCPPAARRGRPPSTGGRRSPPTPAAYGLPVTDRPRGAAPVTDRYDVVVLGAGPAGLMAARKLAQQGRSVVVLERAAAVGGMAGSFEVAGIRVDYGSHRLHRVLEPRLEAELAELLGDDLQRRQRRGRISLKGRWLAFPLRLGDLVPEAAQGPRGPDRRRHRSLGPLRTREGRGRRLGDRGPARPDRRPHLLHAVPPQALGLAARRAVHRAGRPPGARPAAGCRS